MTISTPVDDIRAIIEPWLAAEQLELDDVELVGTGAGRTLRILVDHEDGVDLDRLTEVSDGVGRLIDDLPALQASYQLEVSSPGLERKLKRPQHYRKSVGREVKAKARIDGETLAVRGELIAAGDEDFTVETETGPVTIAYDDVTSARTVFNWAAQPKPGKK